VDLKSYNTLNISVCARSFAAVKTKRELKELLAHPETDIDTLFVIGGGSNILFTGDYNGLILHVEIRGKEILRETDEYVWLKIGAGENWHQTVRYCVERGWGGIENLSLIPGTVGAAPIQNIGAYGVELEEVFEWLEAVNLETAEVKRFEKKECRFGYRDSIFKHKLKGKYVITDVVLKLSRHPKLNTSYGAIQAELKARGIEEPTIGDISDIVIDIRNRKLPDPEVLGNAGSFFKNPVVNKDVYRRIKNDHPNVPGYPAKDNEIKIPAGWLIEKAGWKGKMVGKAGTYEQQALVIVNHGGATGKEILKLAKKISKSVKKQFGISIVPEVNIV
jgi:UDP-N-acetylmuramate dehydrogenase